MSQDDREVWFLINHAERELKNAHDLLKTHISNNQEREGVLPISNYNTFIKSALNSYFKVLRNYTGILDASIQSSLYYKTAHTLFKESMSLDLASDYCTRGIQICNKNEPTLTLTKLKLLYLHFQIKLQLKPINEQVGYLNNIIENEIPGNSSFGILKLFFRFVKFKHFSSLYTVEKNVKEVQLILDGVERFSFANSTTFLQLVLVNLIEYQLMNSQPLSDIEKCLHKLKLINERSSDHLRIQFTSMHHLLDMYLSLYSMDLKAFQEKSLKCEEFRKTLKERKIQLGSNLQFVLICGDSHFVFYSKWMTTLEYFYTTTLYSAVGFSFFSWKNKIADTLFKRLSNNAYDKIQISGKIETLEDFQHEVVRFNYLKSITLLQKILCDFTNDKYPNADEPLIETGLEELVENFNSKRFTGYELLLFSTLIPYIKFILAMVYQRNGHYLKSLYYYSQLIQKKPVSKPSVTGMPLMVSFDALSLYSVLNSVPILQFLIESEKDINKNLSEFDLNYDQSMKRFSNLLRIKDILKQKIETLSYIPENTDNLYVKASINTIQYFYFSNPWIASNTEPFKDSPLLLAILEMIYGYTYKTDPGLSEIDNINNKINHFTRACKYSIVTVNSDSHSNRLAMLGYWEIWNVMNKNKNLFPSEQIEKVWGKYSYFASESSPNPKRVKFN